MNARLRAQRRGGPLVLLHSCGAGGSELFTDAVDVLCVPSSPPPPADSLARLDDFLGRHRDRACAGFCGFDLRDAIEAVPRRIADDFPQPALWIGAFARRSAWGAEAHVVASHGSRHARAVRALDTRDGYEAKVARIVEHIRAGDVFQVNLTQAFDSDFDGDPRELFARLCEVSPAPYAAYVETDAGLAVLSSSPEEFLVADGTTVRTRPIKGTRPRDPDPARDAALLAELLASEKDLAELAMIVDLLRNDLGKVAATGSVAVGTFPEHASFAQVHHLLATVTARLRPGTTTGDLLRATFPGGSITGAPKLRCMEILEDLESCRRGVYCGAIGEFAAGARVRLNVAIRTMVVAGSRVRLHAGGGVTADSEPALEYEESVHKASGMLRALGFDRLP
ncbi:MAG: aminodeoxychorismate synthase component I [Planctomycetes bacterium]|nr:aminodeoxychorismate synthase component I [Planctomycetota bacterium]